MTEKDKEMMAPVLELLKHLEWDIAIPAGGGPEDDGTLKGMIIGTPEYVEYVLKHLE